MKAFTSLRSFLEGDAPRGRRLFLAVLLGLLFALPFSLPALAPLSFLFVAPLGARLFCLVERRVSLRWLYVEGLFAFWGFHFGGFYWFIRMYPLDFVGLSPLEAVLFLFAAMVILPLFLATIWAFIPLLLGGIAPHLPKKTLPLLFPPLLGALAVLVLYAECHTELWIPFVRPALTWAEVPALAQGAALFGAYFLDFLLFTLGGYLGVGGVLLLQKRGALRLRLLPFALALLLFLSNLGVSLPLYFASHEGEEIRVAAIQGNTPSSTHHLRTEAEMIRLYGGLSRDAAAGGATLILWPETAVAFPLRPGNAFYTDVEDLAVQTGAHFAVGAFEVEGAAAYNALFLIPPTRFSEKVTYRKMHPVPFGEYVPGRDIVLTLFPFMGSIAEFNSMLAPADEVTVMGPSHATWQGEERKIPALGGMICFDSIYPDVARENVKKGAELLLLPTNDSWFFDSAAAEMHLSHARLRAIEAGRWVVRSGHTGITALIDEKGNVKEEIPMLREGYVMGDARSLTHTTVYAQVGDVFVLLSLLFTLAFPAIALGKTLGRKWQAHKKKENTEVPE